MEVIQDARAGAHARSNLRANCDPPGNRVGALTLQFQLTSRWGILSDMTLSQQKFNPEARKLRLEQVYQFLRLNARSDGIVMATSRGILHYLERSGEPVHSLDAVRDYIQDLKSEGKVTTIPFSADLYLPDTGSTHGYKRGVLKLVPQQRS